MREQRKLGSLGRRRSLATFTCCNAVAIASFTRTARAAPPSCEATEAHPSTRELADYSTRARRYYYGWGIGALVLAGGQLSAAIAVEDRGLATDLVVGGITSMVGGLATLLLPPPGLSASPPCSVAGDFTLLTVAFEQSQRSWVTHAVGIATGLVSGSILWLGYGRGSSGLTQIVGTIASSEIQIWTVPRGLPTPQASLSASGGGFAVSWSF